MYGVGGKFRDRVKTFHRDAYACVKLKEIGASIRIQWGVRQG